MGMVNRSARSRLPVDDPGTEPPNRENVRLSVRRVRLRSLVRIGFGFGWIASLVPAILTSIALVWVLHGIWTTLDGWKPWTPWSPDARVLGAPLPAPPEFAPREVLRLNGLYRALSPVGHHPVIGAVLIAVVLTFGGEVVLTAGLLAAGIAYNRFARRLGGLELEVVERPARRTPRLGGTNRARANGDDPPDAWDEARLRW